MKGLNRRKIVLEFGKGTFHIEINQNVKCKEFKLAPRKG